MLKISRAAILVLGVAGMAASCPPAAPKHSETIEVNFKDTDATKIVFTVNNPGSEAVYPLIRFQARNIERLVGDQTRRLDAVGAGTPKNPTRRLRQMTASGLYSGYLITWEVHTCFVSNNHCTFHTKLKY